MTDSKPKYLLRAAGNRVQVIESATDLIIRTLDNRPEAIAFIEALDPKRKERK